MHQDGQGKVLRFVASNRPAVMAVASGLVLCSGLAATAAYLLRSSWFVSNGNGILMLALTIGMASATLLAVHGFVETNGRTSVRWMVPIGVAVLAAVAFVASWSTPRPSATNVLAAVEADDLEAASSELAGLVAVAPNDESTLAAQAEVDGLAGRHADIDRASKVHTGSLAEASTVLAEEWHDPETWKRARDEYNARAASQIEEQWQTGDNAGLKQTARLVEPLDASLAERARGLARIVYGRWCLSELVTECITTELEKTSDQDAIAVEHADFRSDTLDRLAAEIRRIHGMDDNDTREPFDTFMDLRTAIELVEAYEDIAGTPLAGVERSAMEKRLDRAHSRLEASWEEIEQRARELRAFVPAESSRSADCCKFCSRGIPCGDSCISASSTCRKPTGCAC